MHHIATRPRLRAVTLAVALLFQLLLAPSSDAQTGHAELSERDAVREAMAHNPSLRAAFYDVKQAHQAALAEDALYMPRLLLNAGVTHDETPRLTLDATTISSSRSYDLGAEVQHTFAGGTALSFRLDAVRSSFTSPFGAGSSNLVTVGPGYNLISRLTFTQPLLRGMGDRVGEASLRQARLSRTAAERARDQLASELLRDVLVAYWELWHAEQALRIEQASLQLAQQRYGNAKGRVDAGADAPIDVLTFETRVAELRQAVLVATTQWQQQSLQLGMLLGRTGAQMEALHAGAAQVPAAAERSRAAVMEAAIEQSQQVAQQKVQLALARERARVAGEAERPRLDLEAFVQAQGLGNGRVPPALEQHFTLGAVSAQTRLVFEMPLSGRRRSAQRRAATAEADAAQERLHAAEQAARLDAATSLLQLKQARRRVKLSATRAHVAGRSAAAQQLRYTHGDGIVLQIHEAEDSQRRARLDETRAQVDAYQASIRIDHLTGALLRRYAKLIQDQPITPRARSGRPHTGLLADTPY